jgi:phospholipid/cholesterol/gamma-HCH transport system substrate-binding protein
MKKFTGPLIGFTVFMVVSLMLTWLVYATLQRNVTGDTTPYAAVFSDAFGLAPGDDVRIAGVRVGRVQKIEVDGNNAKAEFVVQSEQKLYGDTIASVIYQNIVGQRYLGLSRGKTPEPRVLPAHTVIPIDRTDPSFDVGEVINGFEPLFSEIDPKNINNLTQSAIKSLQGDDVSLSNLIAQTTKLTDSFVGEDAQLGPVITNLNEVTKNLAKHNATLEHTITQTRSTVSIFNARRAELVSSMGSISRTMRNLSSITNEVYPSLNATIQRNPGFVRHLLDIEPQVAFAGDNLPLLMKGLGRITNEGAYGNAYGCDLNALGFLPIFGIQNLTPIIVNAATPGNRAWHSPKCRDMTDG